MEVKVILEVTLEELIEANQSYLEIGKEPSGIEALKDNFINNFLTDKNNFIDPAKIKVYFV